MSEQMNAPMLPPPAGVSAWFSIWMTAVTKPNEQTFAALAEHPDARSNSRAFTWVFLAGTVSALISGVLQAILQLAGLSAQTPGLADLFAGNAERGVAFTFGVAICISPIAGVFAVIGFAIGVGIIHWVAKMFNGTGSFSQLAYTMAAISVPLSLVTAVLAPFSTVNFVNICTGLLSLVVGIYAIVLELIAIKSVHKFGWGQAAGSLFLPVIVLLCCLTIPFVLGVMRLLGPTIGNTFSTIQNSLP